MGIIEIIIKWAIPFIFGGIITGCITYARAVRKQSNAERGGLQCLLRAEIIRNYDKYVERGWCPIYAQEALTRAYKAYHDLGGNDVATGLYKAVINLPAEQHDNK